MALKKKILLPVLALIIIVVAGAYYLMLDRTTNITNEEIIPSTNSFISQAGDSTGNASVTTAPVILVRELNSIERALIQDHTAYLEGTSIKLDLVINTTVYNFLRDTYVQWPSLTPQQRLNRCYTIEPYVQEDFPSFSCDNPTHRQILLTRLQNYIEGGFRIVRQGVSSGYINITGNEVSITIPDSYVGEIVSFGEGTLITEYQEANTINYEYNTFSANITLFINEGGVWNSTADNVWVTSDDKFGANISATQDQFLKYELTSTHPIRIRNKQEVIISTGEESITYNFRDICEPRRNMTLVPSEDNDFTGLNESRPSGEVLFDPNCNLELITSTLFSVEFNAEYNDTLGFVPVDPQITVSDFVNDGTNDGTRTEPGNWTHLEVINESLLAYYTFDIDDVSEAYDLTNNDLDLDDQGSATQRPNFDVDGQYGPTTRIDDNNEFWHRDDPPEFDFTDGFTLMAWVDPTGPPGSGWGRIMSKANGATSDAIAMTQQISTNYPVCRITTTSGTTTIQGTTNLGSTTAVNWNHVACRYIQNDFGGWLGVYVNGELEFNVVNTGSTLTTTADDFCIGRHCDSNTRDYEGHIDHVMIWNSSLSGDFINETYQQQVSIFAERGNVSFNNLDVSDTGDEDRVNVTNLQNISYDNSETNITLYVGSASGGSYSYNTGVTTGEGSEVTITNETITTASNISVRYQLYSPTNRTFTPYLISPITIDSWDSGGGGNVTDTCTYGGSGNHEYECSDNCVISTAYDYGGSNITASGTGTLRFEADQTSIDYFFKSNQCTVTKLGSVLLG